MKHYIIYFIILFGVMGCGSRKTKTDISKQTSNVEQKQSEKQDIKTQQSETTKEKETNRADISNVETITTTKYSNGQISETTTTQRAYTDKSINNKTNTIWRKLIITETLTVNKVIRERLEIKTKQKQTERQDVYVYLFFGLLSLVAVYVVGRYFRVIRF